MKFAKGIVAVLVAVVSLVLADMSESRAEAEAYAIDPDHSQVIFKVKHMGISTVTGRFDLVEGSYTFDDKDISNSSVETTITTASINTNKQKRDDHLKSPDFLNVEKYPTITFKSKEVKKGDGEDFTIVGDLTINGVTKHVELDAEYGGKATDPMGNERTAFTAETEIDRKDYGITWNKTLDSGGLVVGDEVKIELEVEGIKKKG
ncbi:MAG: YceI family protein [Thermodesulfobacteriota bacterium]